MFAIEKESDQRNVKVNGVSDNTDDFIVSREDDLGMEYLMADNAGSEVSEAQEDIDQESDFDEEEPAPDTFMSDPESKNPANKNKSFEQIQREKADYLSQLNRYHKKNVMCRKLGMEHSIEEISSELFRVKKEQSLDSGIEYCRQGLLFMMSTIEMANDNFKLGGKISGLSNSVMANLENYDDVFAELWNKYYTDTGFMSPEIKLISMIGGAVLMCHLQNSMALSSNAAPYQQEMEGPDEDLLRQLNEEVDIDDLSDISSQPEIKTIDIPKKAPAKRGRPKKNA